VTSRASRATSAERRRDALALVLLLGGVALFVIAFLGFDRLQAGPIELRAGQRAMPIFIRYVIVTAAGLALVLAGLATAVWSYLRRRRVQNEP
jgi:hypothetical protein